MILIILTVAAILPSLALIMLGFWAYKQQKKFLYYNFSFAASCSSLFLIWFLVSFIYGDRDTDAQDGLVFLTIPVWSFIFGIGSLLVGIIVNPFVLYEEIKQIKKTSLPAYPFWISVASLICFALFWLIQIIIFRANKIGSS